MIEVHVLIFPDGSTLWLESPTRQEVEAAFTRWREHNTGPEWLGSSCAFAIIKMPPAALADHLLRHPLTK